MIIKYFLIAISIICIQAYPQQTEERKYTFQPNTSIDDPKEDEASNDSLVPEEITKVDPVDVKDVEINIDGIVDQNIKIALIDEETRLLDEDSKVSYSGSQMWRVITEDSHDKKSVIGKLNKAKEIAMWGGNRTSLDILVKSNTKDKVKKQLSSNGINYEIIINDIQEAIDDENKPALEEDSEELENRQGHRMTWSSYHRLQDIYDYMDFLATTYPSLCKLMVIGTSVQGRPLKVLKISSTTSKTDGSSTRKSVWVDGGIHAREWISPATVTYIMNQFILNMENEPEAIKGIDWYFMPVVNPDGYEYSHQSDRLWRKNRSRGGFGRYCSGTDLNRNFGYHWGEKGSGSNSCQEIYAGTGAFSEPETAAIRNFITGGSGVSTNSWKAYISFHSYGQYILYPWGYDRLITDDNEDLQNVARKAANAILSAGGPQYTIGPAAATLYPASGGSDDWAKGTIRMKYAYTIELRDSGRYGFLLPANYIQPTATEALAALRVIGEAAGHIA